MGSAQGSRWPELPGRPGPERDPLPPSRGGSRPARPSPCGRVDQRRPADRPHQLAARRSPPSPRPVADTAGAIRTSRSTSSPGSAPPASPTSRGCCGTSRGRVRPRGEQQRRRPSCCCSQGSPRGEGSDRQPRRAGGDRRLLPRADIMAESGARLVEVGTTTGRACRTTSGPSPGRPALLLKVHGRTFSQHGFTEEVPDLPTSPGSGRGRGSPSWRTRVRGAPRPLPRTDPGWRAPCASRGRRTRGGHGDRGQAPSEAPRRGSSWKGRAGRASQEAPPSPGAPGGQDCARRPAASFGSTPDERRRGTGPGPPDAPRAGEAVRARALRLVRRTRRAGGTNWSFP